MQRTNIYPTPIQYSPYLSDLMNADLYLKREDLYSSGGGGSKARMLDYILIKAKSENAEYVLTAGGPYSNFNRALALKSKQYGLKVKLVLYDKNSHLNDKNLNKRICDYCEVEYIPCDPTEVIETIENEKYKFKEKGVNYYYIWGGGKSSEGVQAYSDCVIELKNQIEFTPDYIITPIGTGTTFSGLSIGCENFLPNTRTIGISIARVKKDILTVIDDILSNYREMSHFERTVHSMDLSDNIFDEFILGGYGKVNNEYLAFIKSVILNESLIFDDIYVGKTLFGIYQLSRRSEMFKNKNIVFINTGGLYNF